MLQLPDACIPRGRHEFKSICLSMVSLCRRHICRPPESLSAMIRRQASGGRGTLGCSVRERLPSSALPGDCREDLGQDDRQSFRRPLYAPARVNDWPDPHVEPAALLRRRFTSRRCFREAWRKYKDGRSAGAIGTSLKKAAELSGSDPHVLQLALKRAPTWAGALMASGIDAQVLKHARAGERSQAHYRRR